MFRISALKKSCLVLMICLLCSVMGVALGAEFTINVNGVITEYSGSETELVIPDTVNGVSVTGIGKWVFENATGLTSVTLPEGVTSIGNGAFSGCTNLASIHIPSAVTSIQAYAFSDCSSLTNITLPDGLTTLGGFTFAGCSNLTELVIPEDITSIGWCTFSSCSSLTSLVIPDGVTTIGERAFQNCSSMKSISIPDSVTLIEKLAFDGCSALEKIILPGQKAPDFTLPDNVTICCYKSTVVADWAVACGYQVAWLDDINDLSELDFTISASGVITGYTGSAKELVIPATIQGIAVTAIGNEAFQGCASLTSVAIPAGVTSIGGYAFGDCANLASISIPEGVTSIGGFAFTGCTSLASIVLPDGADLNGWGTFYGCTALASVSLPESVTFIGERAFYNCKSLTVITIPDSVTKIEKLAFDGCTAMEKVSVPTLEGWLDTTIEGILANPVYYAKNLYVGENLLTDLVIPAGTTTIAYHFMNCSDLASVVIPDSVTTIGDCAFYKCVSLTSVTIPQGTVSIGLNAFDGCSRLWSVSIPDSATSVADSAFENCSALQRVIFPGQNVPAYAPPYGVTVYCYQSTAVIDWAEAKGYSVVCLDNTLLLPDSLLSIEAEAFMNTSASIIVVPNGCTTIGSKAFASCDGALVLYLPDSVTQIAGDAFEGSSDVSFVCDSQNAAASYAAAHGIPCIIP